MPFFLLDRMYMMSIMYIMITLSATEARNRFFELIEKIAYLGQPVLVERNKKPMVRIEAVAKAKPELTNILKIAKDTFGMCPDGVWPSEQTDFSNREKTANQNW